MTTTQPQQGRQPAADLRETLLRHPIYRRVDSIPRLRVFMQAHVFAVWDFMSLVKRLQHEVCGVDLPWQPPTNPRLSRFVNDLVRDEESDLGPDGRPISHFELYLAAMAEVGADDKPIRTFVQQLERGDSVIHALEVANAPRTVARFVSGTIKAARQASLAEVAAEFCYGREDVIPSMFRSILESGETRREAQAFAFYLKRHIELDGSTHRAAAEALIRHATAGDPTRVQLAERSAEHAIQRRIALWDGVLASLPARRNDSPRPSTG